MWTECPVKNMFLEINIVIKILSEIYNKLLITSNKDKKYNLPYMPEANKLQSHQDGAPAAINVFGNRRGTCRAVAKEAVSFGIAKRTKVLR